MTGSHHSYTKLDMKPCITKFLWAIKIIIMQIRRHFYFTSSGETVSISAIDFSLSMTVPIKTRFLRLVKKFCFMSYQTFRYYL